MSNRLVPRSSFQIPIAVKAQIIIISVEEPSIMAASTTWPRPERWASSIPQTMPNAISMPPPPKSPMRLIGGVGFSPARPRWASTPPSAM